MKPTQKAITQTRIYTHPKNQGQYYDKCRLVVAAQLTKQFKHPNSPNVIISRFRGWYKGMGYSPSSYGETIPFDPYEFVKSENVARNKILLEALHNFFFREIPDTDYFALPLGIVSASEDFLDQLESDLAQTSWEEEELPRHIPLLKHFMNVDALLISKELSRKLYHGDITPETHKEIFK